jgi:hypothetical protein
MAGFETFETTIPIIAMIQGKNGLGKSSLLDCLKYGVGRGHDEDMIHGDAPEGEILIQFDNGAAVKCRAVRERNETVRAWRAPGSKRFVVSREQIDQICNSISYDALAFMDRDEAEQMKILLRIMPIECTEEEIAAALGGVAVDIDQPVISAMTGNALDKITVLHKQIYSRRREHNVRADEQEKHAKELERTLPPAAPGGTDWNAEVTRIRGEQAQFERQVNAKLAEVKQIFDAERSSAIAEYEDSLKAAALARDARIEHARVETEKVAAEIQLFASPKLEELNLELGQAQERARALAEAEGTRKAITAARDGATAQRVISDKLTAALQRLDELKTTVASRFSIKGVTIQDGRILREENGKLVPFKRWNTEFKIRFCLRIAVLAHGEAGFICVDNVEHLDQEKRLALIATAEKYAERDGLQFILASVYDGPLEVKEATTA